MRALLTAWHDAMVAHERRLRTGRTTDACDDECPHDEARTLWAEALLTLGSRAGELTFLRSRRQRRVDRRGRENGFVQRRPCRWTADGAVPNESHKVCRAAQVSCELVGGLPG